MSLHHPLLNWLHACSQFKFFIFQFPNQWFGNSRACLKIAFRQLYVTLCGRLGPNEGGVVGYAD
ncbi:DUF6783 domain-containing protein [Hungatella hominis]|uniref:DUF6783 domain-containing protein n=1 Tax=Hungatella hominis TaxID=2763050 RepID=UPI0032E4F702